MNNNFLKRLIAYFVDILILNLILSFISSMFNSNNIGLLNGQMNSLMDEFVEGKMVMSIFFNRYSSLIYSLDRELFMPNLLSVVCFVIYFVVIPLNNNGMSFGKKLMGIQIVCDDESKVDSNKLLFRYMFMNGIGFSIITLCCLFVFNDTQYTIILGFLGFFEFLVLIISIFMVLYRGDKKSLPDLIAGTKVIEVKK
jgi:uncharacterized RDD family membrane protein YckC